MAILHRDPLPVHHLIKQYCVPTWSNLQSVAAILKSVERPGLVTASSNLATCRYHARSTAGSLKRRTGGTALGGLLDGFSWASGTSQLASTVLSAVFDGGSKSRACVLHHANEPSTHHQGRDQRWSVSTLPSPHLISNFMLILEQRRSGRQFIQVTSLVDRIRS